MRRLLFSPLLLLFFQCHQQQVESVSVKGSDTEVNLVLLLAEAYMDIEPGVSMSITGGGSGVGIAALLNDKTDIANSSRELSAYENKMALERGIQIEPFIFAADALAIIVHPSVQIDSLSLDELGKIYAGEIQDWSQISRGSGPVSLYGRQSNSGTFMYFRERVLKRDFSPDLKQMNGTAQILEAVKADPGAIGYVGLGYLTDGDGAVRAGIRVVRLMSKKGEIAVSPLDRALVQRGLYPLTRPLYQFTNGIPEGQVKAFQAFETSPAGKKIIADNGYLSAKDAGLAFNTEK